ncbi:CobD/CbiB family protein [Massilia psychrophila]|uniref:Cobalamin biosynthesis protein CobD n=1 Tax=Massilia psychrophila TaxID=1603353 RepID=A0A2G8T500_9BURK|nr:CobD/CbiB family protein [Massilia psychrophila]PIL41094.1 cobalamin biosynthesis protein CobD [Massilia psychrophila]GGE66421.1 cobalamin biosynthesis protein CobD [Massilia psychrophila]
MTFLSILCALLIEQLKPLRADNMIYAEIKSFAKRIESWFNAGDASHGRLGWILMMAALMVPTALVYWVLLHFGLVFAAFAWNVLIVYLTLGFRHYSHYFTSIQMALGAGDEPTARSLLAEWIRIDTVGMEATEIARLAVEKSLVTTHRNVFGVFFWFLMPLGPACAVMYRVAEYLARAWNEPDHMRGEAFGQFAAKAFYWIDWLPVRLTAVAFAVVGNFEDAIYAWRNFAYRWSDPAKGIILTAGGGAMGVRLGTPYENASGLVLPPDAATVDSLDPEAEVLPGEEPNLRALQSTVGLVWRALLLWMMLLLLLSGAVWLG